MARPKCACLNPNAPRRQFGSLRVLPSGKHQARYVDANGQLPRRRGRSPRIRTRWRSWPRCKRTWSEARGWRRRLSRTCSATTPRSGSRTGTSSKPRTRAHYRVMLDRFILPAFGDTDLTQITAADVRTWHAKLTTGKVFKRQAYGLLRSILRTAVVEGLITCSPCVLDKTQLGSSKPSKKIKTAELDEGQAR